MSEPTRQSEIISQVRRVKEDEPHLSAVSIAAKLKLPRQLVREILYGK